MFTGQGQSIFLIPPDEKGGGENWNETLTLGAETGGVNPQISENDLIEFLNSTFKLELKTDTLTADKVQTLQDKSGVIALLSDIITYLAENGLNLNGSTVEMGGDLIKNTQIDYKSFRLLLRDTLSPQEGGGTTDIYTLANIDNTKGGDFLRIGYNVATDQAETEPTGTAPPIDAVLMAGKIFGVYAYTGISTRTAGISGGSTTVRTFVNFGDITSTIWARRNWVQLKFEEFNSYAHEFFIDNNGIFLKYFPDQTNPALFQQLLFQGKMLVDDTLTNKGLENNGDYEGNFTARSLVTKQFTENLKQGYTETFGVTFMNTAPITWEIVTVAGAPPDTVIEIMISNNFAGSENGGVRSVGSVLNRIGATNSDSFVLKVKTNGSNQIEIYSTNIARISFNMVGINA
jgi:hypothetical protein